MTAPKTDAQRRTETQTKIPLSQYIYGSRRPRGGHGGPVPSVGTSGTDGRRRRSGRVSGGGCWRATGPLPLSVRCVFGASVGARRTVAAVGFCVFVVFKLGVFGVATDRQGGQEFCPDADPIRGWAVLYPGYYLRRVVTMSKKQTKKPATEQVVSKAEQVAQQTVADIQRYEEFVASLPVVTMRKVNNQWFATMPKAAAKLTSQVAILREYNKGYPSIKVVTLDFAGSDEDNYFFTYNSLVK